MDNNIEEVQDKLDKAAKFVSKHPNAPGFLDVTTLRLDIPKRECATAGKVFGKTGWTRTASWTKTFNWKKTIDGVEVVIQDAEDNDLIGSPVPATAFPIQLEDAAEV